VAGSCEHNYELSGTMNFGELRSWLDVLVRSSQEGSCCMEFGEWIWWLGECVASQPVVYLVSQQQVSKFRWLLQGCSNPPGQVTLVTKFCTVASNMFGSPVRNLMYGAHLTTGIVRWLLDFWKSSTILNKLIN
jgi:hypothetical protein